MDDEAAKKAADIFRRIHGEVADDLDEEMELELDDDRVADTIEGVLAHPAAESEGRKVYFRELLRLQRELIKLQDWILHKKLKVVVLFEGRDAAGKGGVIKRITQRLNPRVCRVAALPAPSERSQWYFQRYAAHLPAGGEMVLFDRSWYNRAGVERMPKRAGIILTKCWFSITDDEQNLRFLMRIHDPLKQWKLSPIDLESRRRWEAYTKAREIVLERTHFPEAPWHVVEAVHKKRARLNCIAHLLTQIPYDAVPHFDPVPLARERRPDYARAPLPQDLYVPDVYADLID
jgi:polyphosphate kinase